MIARDANHRRRRPDAPARPRSRRCRGRDRPCSSVWAVRRWIPATREGFDAEVSSQMLGVVASLFGLLLAFVVVIEFQAFSAAGDNVESEADGLAAIVRDSCVFGDPGGATRPVGDRRLRARRRRRGMAADARRQGERGRLARDRRRVRGDAGLRAGVVVAGGVLRRLGAPPERGARGPQRPARCERRQRSPGSDRRPHPRRLDRDPRLRDARRLDELRPSTRSARARSPSSSASRSSSSLALQFPFSGGLAVDSRPFKEGALAQFFAPSK